MIKKTLLFTLCFLAFTASIAQSKMNFALTKKVQETQNTDQIVDVFVQGDMKIVKELVTSIGGTFKYSTGNIASVSITIQQLTTIITNKAVRRIEAYPPTIYPFNDSSNLQTNVLPVHAGTAPLTQPYFGNDIVLGFIDTGIDITHPDFKDALGKTRIKYIWDHRATPVNPPAGYTYGIEWDSASIDGGSCTHIDNPTFTGHGTHVVGRAAGNGLSLTPAQYISAAPNVDIIMVALDFTGTARATAVVDAIQYIYAKALALGKPCVINGSFGGDFGSHDGHDLESQIISALIDQNPGQAFVAAAGNSGNKAFHLGYTVNADTNFTMFAKAGSGVYLQMWADTNDFKNVQFAIGADQIVPTHSFRGRTAFHSIATMPFQTVVDDTVWNNGNRIGKMQMYLDTMGGAYSLDIQLVPDTAAYYWRLMTTGSGEFDLWNFNNSTGVSTAIIGYQGTGLPSLATMPDSMYYKAPDKNKTISTGFQCLDNVITVANYTDRKSYTQYNGTPCGDAACNTAVPGRRVISSAIGPTRDGRIKPDIAAPGDMAIAAAEVNYRNGLIGAGNTVTLAQGGMHNRNGGTSHAAPAVAGIAALYLEKNPTATAAQVKNAIIRCTIQDQFTGCLLPDNYWGYGKVNAFGALTEMLATTQPRDTTVCEGSNATFTAVASGTGVSYQWIIEQNDTCFNLNNVAPYSGVTTNTLTITAVTSALSGSQYRCIASNTYSCDITTDSAILSVNPLPTITASSSANTVCAGAMLTLTGAGATTYTLTGGAVNAVAFVSPAIPTTYTVVGTDGNGCKDTTTIAIQVNALPIVTANASASTVCVGASITLTGGGATSYVWAGGEPNGVPFTPTAGINTYTVTGTDLNNCVDSDETTITTTALPIVTSSGLDANYCIDAAAVTLTGTPAGGTFSGTGITSGAAGTFDPVTAGSGTITITYTYTDGNNCNGISTQSTTVLTPAVSADSCPTLLPPGMDSNVSNIFTPNNDGINDEFKVSYNGAPASDFNLSIFNRWGIPVFTSNNPNVKWDGHTTSGIKVSAGTYFYVLVNAGTTYKGYIALFD